MARPTPSTAATRLVAAVTAAASAVLGRELPVGTTVVASPERAGSRVAVAYPLGDRTIVWCAPELGPDLASLNGPAPLSTDDFLVRAGDLGGAVAGSGHHRVLSIPAPDPAIGPTRLAVLDRDDADDRSLISAFVDACSADDLDEAELSMSELDEAIVGVLGARGELASYASARPWLFDAQFDDIAVITHPVHRGQGLGTAAVAALSQRRQARERTMFYSCAVANVGSNRVAEAVGFQRVYTVTGVSFD